MKTLINTAFITILSAISLNSQTVVKMVLPPQSTEHVRATTLFDEALLSGMPTAIGIMGYDVHGGYLPYTYQWLENETVIKQGDVALITPTVGNSYSLKVIDSKNCSVIIPIEINAAKNGDVKGASEQNHFINSQVTRTLVTIITSSDIEIVEMDVTLYDINGKVILSTSIAGDAEIAVNLSPGVYLLHTNTLNSHNVAKHVVY